MQQASRKGVRSNLVSISTLVTYNALYFLEFKNRNKIIFCSLNSFLFYYNLEFVYQHVHKYMVSKNRFKKTLLIPLHSHLKLFTYNPNQIPVHFKNIARPNTTRSEYLVICSFLLSSGVEIHGLAVATQAIKPAMVPCAATTKYYGFQIK